MAIQQIPGGLGAYQKISGLEQSSETLQSKSLNINGNQISAEQITIRNDKQASLVAHLFGDPNKAIEDSLKMTFQAAIEKLNEKLQADLGENAISEEALEKQGGMEYWTPENTAKRIVDGSTAFLSGFQKAHPELEGEALMNKFMDVVGGGLQQGFDEAQGILGDLKVFNGLVEDNFTSTVDLVKKGMEDYKNSYLGIPSNPTSKTDAETNVAESVLNPTEKA